MIGRRLPMIARCKGGALWVSFVACALAPAMAHDGARQNDADRPLVYRRVFVPGDNVSAWPRNGEKYLPVESRDFEAWVARANRTAGPSAGRITLAIYSGRMEGPTRLAGRGQWEISVAGKDPDLTPLNSPSLAIHEAHWSDARSTPARLGAWAQSGEIPSGFALEAPHSGVLNFHWSAHAQAADHEATFDWKLPPAVTNRLILDLPAGKRPVWGGAVVLRSDDLPQENEPSDGKTATTLRDAAASESSVLRRWELVAGPDAEPTLRIIDERAPLAASKPTPASILRENLDYQIGLRGLELEAQLQLENSPSGLRQLSIPLPPEVQLISATVDGKATAWNLQTSEDHAAPRAIIQLPPASLGADMTVVLNAWQPAVTNSAWQLPRLRPSDVSWVAGSIRVAASSLVEIQSLETKDCVQVGAELSSDDERPETISLSAYSPDASVQVKIAPRRPEIAARTGTTLVVGHAEVTGRTVTRFEVARGAMHSVSGELAPGWSVDAVETTPGNALGEWYVVDHDGRRIVVVRFADAVRPERPVMVTLSGRSTSANLGSPLTSEMLQMVRWKDLNLVRHLWALQTVDPFVVESVAGLVPVATESITEDDRTLLPSGTTGAIYDMLGATDAAVVHLSTKRAQYTAEILLQVNCSGNELQPTYYFTCRPQSGRIEQILAYFSARVDGDIRWIDKSSGEAVNASRVSDDDPRRAALPSDGELWQLRFAQPQAHAVEIEATAPAPLKPRPDVPLLSLPEAAAEQGRVFVFADSKQNPQIQARGLQPVSLPSEFGSPADATPNAPLLAAYRFEPRECRGTGDRPQLWIEPATRGTAAAPLYARRLEIESFYAADGEVAHRVTYHLQNERAASLPLRLPEGATTTSVQLNGRSIDELTPQNDPSALAIPLTAGRPATVSLSFTTREPPLGQGRRLQPPQLAGDLPILAGEWTVWMPEEYVVLGADAPADGALNWRQRLFGPLARPTTARPFHLLEARSWMHLLASWADETPLETGTSSLLTDVNQAFESDTQRPGAAPTRHVTSATARSQNSELAGWRAHRRVFLAAVPEPIVVAHPPATAAWSIATFLMCLVGGGFLRPQAGLAKLIAVGAILCLLLPATFAPLATGAFLGSLTSLFVRWPSSAEPSETPTRTWTRLAATGASTIALLMALATLAAGQNPGASEATTLKANAATIHQVLIPVDAERRPVGTKLYVDEQLLRQLVAQNDRGPRGGEWLLRAVDCRGELRRAVAGQDVAPASWTMSFQLEVLARDTIVRLPLVRDEADWGETVQLDGIPLPLEWDAAGRSCSVHVPEPGRFELTATLVPRVGSSEDTSEIVLHVPQQPGAKIELRYPAELNGLDVVGASLQSEVDSGSRLVRGEMDASGRLTVHWPRAQTIAAAKESRLTELRWLQIHPNSVDLQVKYIVPRDARLPQLFVILADRHWQLISDENLKNKIRISSEADSRQRVAVSLEPEDRDRGSISLRWRLATPPTMGRLRLPAMLLESTQPTTTWLAITSDPALEWEIVNPSGLPTDSGEEFTALWGNDGRTEPPQLVLPAVPSAGDVVVGIQPETSQSSIDEVLHVAVESDRIRVRYEAEVAPGREHRFAFPLLVPDELRVDQVLVTQSGRPIPLRWSRPLSGQINVFFAQELSEPYAISLAGHVSTNGADARPLPRIYSPAVKGAAERVQVYRNESVLVDVLGPANADDAAPALPPAGWNGRLLGAFQLEPSLADQVRLAVAPNRVEVEGAALTTLAQQDSVWWATWSARLSVKYGELFSLQLLVPAKWVGPFEVQPAGAVAATTTAAGPQRLLTLRLPEPIRAGETSTVEIRGPIAPESGAPISVPQIVLANPGKWQHFLSLPTAVQAQAVEWKYDGVQETDLPENLRSRRAPETPIKVYRVTDPTHGYRVALSLPQAAQPTASVRLADTIVLRGQMGNRLVATRFVVSPQSRSECELELPEGAQLVDVNLDGRPARIRFVDQRRWHVSLGAPQLPQILDVLARDDRRLAPSRRAELERPRLLSGGAPLPVEMSLWSFGQMRIAEPVRVENAAITNAADQAALRLDRLASTAEAAATTAAGLPAPDGLDWFRSWAQLLAQAQAAARSLHDAHVATGSASQVTSATGDQLATAIDRISLWMERSGDALRPAGAPALQLGGAVQEQQAWPPAVDGIDDWVYCVAEGNADRIVVQLSGNSLPSRFSRLLGAAAVAGMALAGVWLARQKAARDLVYRWPHAVGTLAGLVWWLWLWPSWLGLLIIAASLYLLFRSDWLSPSVRAEPSTVVRSPSPR